MVRVLARSIVGVALLALGAAGGVALAARPEQPAADVAVSGPAPPVEVRTVVKRRTVHVYRKPHRPRPRPAAVSTPRSAPPAPVVQPPAVRVIHPVAPAAPAHPLVTRTSGSAGGGGEHEGDREGEHDD